MGGESVTTLPTWPLLKVNKTISNYFWNNVLEAASGVLEQQTFLNSEQILTTPLWYNSKLLSDQLFIPDWYRKGIFLISDILDTDGQIMSLEMLEIMYGFHTKFFASFECKSKV